MTKQPTPLEAAKELVDIAYDKVRSGWEDKKLERHILDLGNIIETALKDCKKQKNYYAKLLESVLNDKEHKALEIIKEKNVNTFLVRQCKNYIEYNRALANQGVVGARHFNLTKEEFDLLKEVLK